MENTPQVTNPSQKAKAHPSTKALLIAGAVVLVLGGIVAATRFLPTSSGEEVVTKSTGPAPLPTPALVATKISVLEPGTLILSGGFADASVLPTATGYRMYVNTFGNGPSGIVTYTSPDGKTWTKEKGVVISSVATGRAIQLPTGVRYYYPGLQPINPADPQADIFSSFSTDGTTFTKDAGKILSPRAGYFVEGPTVFQLPDKTWRMYFNENTLADGNNRHGDIWGASSTDGVTWTRDAALTLEADGVTEKDTKNWKQALHPFVLAHPNGGYIMFYNAHSELYAATSKDGITWTKIGSIGIHGADADGYFQKDGTIRLYYGDFSAKTSGVIYTAVLSVE